jgi:hypothetical protein
MPSSKGRGVGFPVDEINVMLDCIDDILPIGMNEWEMVERRHHQVYQGVFRSKESLKRKFRTLCVMKIPTGDPNCPAEVRRAKHLYELIQRKSDLSEGEGEDNNDNEQDDNDGTFENEQDDSSSRDGQEAGVAAVVAPEEGNEDEGEELHDRRRRRSEEDQQGGGPPVDQLVLGGTEAPPFETPMVRNSSRKKPRHQRSHRFSREGSITTSGSEGDHGGGESDDFSMKNVMKMMVLQQQMDQEHRRHQEQRMDEEAKERRDANATVQQLLAAILTSTTKPQTHSTS